MNSSDRQSLEDGFHDAFDAAMADYQQGRRDTINQQRLFLIMRELRDLELADGAQ